MATQYAFGKIVTNGLVLALDAADKNSYPGSGTTWRDVSGNNYSGSLLNGPTFSSANGGSIVFDGADDYISVSTITWTPTAFTVSWFTKGNNTLSFNQAIGAANGWGAFSCHTDANGSFYVGTDLANRLTPSNISNGTYVIGVYQQFTFSFESGTGAFYKNGSLLASKSMITPVAWTGFNIGAPSSATIHGSIANTQIYNRALSASEVLQNYNAQKSRFNL